MDDRVVASCGSDDQTLFILSREGATLHEVALPFKSSCIATFATTVAVGGHEDEDEDEDEDGDDIVCLVGVEAGNIIATLPIPTYPFSLAFNEQGMTLACGMGGGLFLS